MKIRKQVEESLGSGRILIVGLPDSGKSEMLRYFDGIDLDDFTVRNQMISGHHHKIITEVGCARLEKIEGRVFIGSCDNLFITIAGDILSDDSQFFPSVISQVTLSQIIFLWLDVNANGHRTRSGMARLIPPKTQEYQNVANMNGLARGVTIVDVGRMSEPEVRKFITKIIHDAELG